MGIWYRTGTVSVSNGSPVVTGVGTGFTSLVKPGDFFFGGANNAIEVLSVESPTQITLAEDWPFTTLTDASYAVAQGPKWGDASGLATLITQSIAAQVAVYGGTGVPADSLGVDGSVYFRSDVIQYYAKESGTWVLKANLVGPPGAAAVITATSATSRGIGATGTMSFTVAAGLSFQIGMRVRVAATSSPTNYMEGYVSAYSGTLLSITMDYAKGSGTFTGWSIGAAGDPGSKGDSGASTFGTSTTSLDISTGSKTFTTQAGLALGIGSRVRIANSASNYMDGQITAYSGTSMTVAADFIAGSGTFTAWNISIVGVQGGQGIQGIQGNPGAPNVLSIGTVATGAAGSNAAASISGTSPAQTLDLTIPKGDKGDTGDAGPANTLVVGTVATGEPGTEAAVSITGSAPTQTVNFVIPQGDVGPQGQGIEPDARGLFAGRSAHDAEAQGFAYLSIDGDGSAITTPVLFLKLSAVSGDWSDPVSIAIQTGAPLVILATGQSNFVRIPDYSWTPAPNAKLWNWDGTTTHVGTAFQAISNTKINCTWKFASDIAYANPDRTVYLVNISIGSQPIAQWLPGASSPDMYADVKANLEPALTAIGVDKVDALFWWQGEADAPNPTTWPANFESVISRFKDETWFPQTTPVFVYAVTSEAVSAAPGWDRLNRYLQSAVNEAPDTRTFIYTSFLSSDSYDPASPIHMTAEGYERAGALGAQAFLGRDARRSLGGLLVDTENGNVTVGKTPATSPLTVNRNSTELPTPPFGTMVHVANTEGGAVRALLDGFGGGIPNLTGRISRGTAVAPSATLANDTLLAFSGFGYGATSFSSSARASLKFAASENWTDTAQGCYMDLSLTPPGTTAIQPVLRVTGDGNFVFHGTAPKTNIANYFGVVLTPSFQLLGGSAAQAFAAFVGDINSGNGPTFAMAKGRASGAAIQSGDNLGTFEFSGSDGTNYQPAAAIIATSDATPGAGDMPGRLSLLTTADGAATVTERVRIDRTGAVMFPSIATTANAANAYLNSGSSPANSLLRSTSSGIYKRDVEDIDPKLADAVLSLRPVWYRSKCKDDPANWSWYGLIAEEVAAVDPRLVPYGYQDDAWEDVEIVTDEEVPDTETIEIEEPSVVIENGRPILKKIRRVETREKAELKQLLDESGNVVNQTVEVDGKQVEQPVMVRVPVMKTVRKTRMERRLKEGAQKVPDGVAYDRLAVLLLDVVKRQQRRIEALEAKVKK